jgi:hypothetical protein
MKTHGWEKDILTGAVEGCMNYVCVSFMTWLIAIVRFGDAQ